MKRLKQMIIIIMLLFIFSTTAYGTNDEIMKQQQSSLNISGFIDASQKYTEEIFPDLNLSDLMESAIKGEVTNNV